MSILFTDIFKFGIVEDIMDPLEQGRVRVRVIGIHSEDKTEIPTEALPWSKPGLPTTSAFVSGYGGSPTGLLQGSMVAVSFLDEGFQEYVVLWSFGAARVPYKNSSYGFTDPQGIFPVVGAQSDVSPWAQGEDVQENPMEIDPVNTPMNKEQEPATYANVDGEYFSLSDYFMGRDKAYPNLLTQEIIDNATDVTKKVNLLLGRFYKANPTAAKRKVNSGWRPPAVNANTPGAATRSNHLIGAAVDISDGDGMLDEWCSRTDGRKAIEEIGLWMEHKNYTPRWAHFQIKPPRSGARYFSI